MSTHPPPRAGSRVDARLQRVIEAVLTDRPIAYHASLARGLRSVTAGVFLSQLLYWTPRAQDGDGWVWKTQEQIADETALTRFEQETARKVLRAASVLEEKRAGLPARLYFRVDLDRLVELLDPERTLPGRDTPVAREEAAREEGPVQDAAKPQSRVRDSRRQRRGIPADPHVTSPQPIHGTEITPETTAERGGRRSLLTVEAESDVATTLADNRAHTLRDAEMHVPATVNGNPVTATPLRGLQSIWRVVLADLSEQMVPTNYARWLERTRLLDRNAGVAVVGVPDQICAEQLARRFDPLVHRALADALGEVVAVRYQVMEG